MVRSKRHTRDGLEFGGICRVSTMNGLYLYIDWKWKYIPTGRKHCVFWVLCQGLDEAKANTPGSAERDVSALR